MTPDPVESGNNVTAHPGHPGAVPPPAATPMAERLISRAAIVALSPLMVLRGVVAKATTGRIFEEHVRRGPAGRPVVIRSFAGSAVGRRLGYLLSVARGDLRLIGPQPLPLDDPDQVRHPHDVTPGLLSPHRLRARTGIDYEPEPSRMDQNLFAPPNASLVARYAVAELINGGDRPTPQTLDLLGVRVANTTIEATLEWIAEASYGDRTRMLAFVNPDCLNQAVEVPEYRRVLIDADRVVPDGIGLKVAARIQGIDVAQNVNGTDLFPRLCEFAAERDLPIYLLGGRPGIAAAAADAMRARFPETPIVGARHGYFGPEEVDEVIADINSSGARVLLVGFGVPKQELWIDAHRDRLAVGVVAGVGGLFDFYSGRIPRAPLWVRELGLEWSWRLAQEPSRMWRRYLIGNPLFLTRVALEARRRGLLRRSSRPALLNYPPEVAAPTDGDESDPADRYSAVARADR